MGQHLSVCVCMCLYITYKYIQIDEANRQSSVVSLRACDKMFWAVPHMPLYFTTCSKRHSFTWFQFSFLCHFICFAGINH